MFEFLIAIIVGLLINEVGELSPWIANRLVKWAVKHKKTAIRYELEQLANLDVIPGQLFKLLHALSFASGQIPAKCVLLFSKDSYHFSMWFAFKIYSHAVNIVCLFIAMVCIGLLFGDYVNAFSGIPALISYFVSYFLVLKTIKHPKIAHFVFNGVVEWMFRNAIELEKQNLFDWKEFRNEYLDSD